MYCHQVLGPMDALDVFEELHGCKVLGKVHLDDYLPKTDLHLSVLDVYILFFYTPHMSPEKSGFLVKVLRVLRLWHGPVHQLLPGSVVGVWVLLMFPDLVLHIGPLWDYLQKLSYSLLIHILQEFVWFSSEGVSHWLYRFRKTLHQMSEILVYFAEAA